MHLVRVEGKGEGEGEGEGEAKSRGLRRGLGSGPGLVLGLLRAAAVHRARQTDARRIEQMKLSKAAAADLKSENVEVVGFAEKAVDASAGLPEGWAAAVDSDGDTYYVRSQLCHLPRRCPPPPELGPASSRCAVEQGDGRDAVGGSSVRRLSRDVCPPLLARAAWARRRETCSLQSALLTDTPARRVDVRRARGRAEARPSPSEVEGRGWYVVESIHTVECVTV